MTKLLDIIVEDLTHRFPDLIAIYQFGSSIEEQLYNDIDLLLLSEGTYYSDFKRELTSFVDILLNDPRPSGFSPDLLQVHNYCIGRTKYFHERELEYHFIFGPISINHPKINIHVKGPMNHEQFELFKELMPLHYNSFISNNKVLYKRRETMLEFKETNIEFGTYELFNRSLLKRVSLESSLEIKHKLYKKMYQNYSIYCNCNIMPFHFTSS